MSPARPARPAAVRALRRLAPAAIALLCGCASGGGGSSGAEGRASADSTFSVDVRRDASGLVRDLPFPADRVWAVLPAAFADIGYQGGPSQAASGALYLTPPMRVRGRLYPDASNSAYLDCGRTGTGGAAANEYSISFAVLVRVHPRDAASSTLEILLDGEARERTTSTNAVPCRGTGRIEEMFAQAIERRLGITR